MNNSKTFVALVVVLVIATLGLFFPTSKTIVERVTEKLGAVSGPNVFDHMFFNAGTTSGGITSTTTGEISAYTTAAKDFAGMPTTILWTPNLNQTVTITATSTHEFIPNVGDVANIYFENASTTAGATITFAAANANVDLQMAEATGGDLVLNGLDWAKITLIRTSLYKTTVIFDEMTEAD